LQLGLVDLLDVFAQVAPDVLKSLPHFWVRR
jgi:hypothetical protein